MFLRTHLSESKNKNLLYYLKQFDYIQEKYFTTPIVRDAIILAVIIMTIASNRLVLGECSTEVIDYFLFMAQLRLEKNLQDLSFSLKLSSCTSFIIYRVPTVLLGWLMKINFPPGLYVPLFYIYYALVELVCCLLRIFVILCTFNKFKIITAILEMVTFIPLIIWAFLEPYYLVIKGKDDRSLLTFFLIDNLTIVANRYKV